MDQIVAAEAETVISFVPEIQDGAADKAKGCGALEKAYGQSQGGKKPGTGQGPVLCISVEVLLSFLSADDESFFLISRQLPADSLSVKKTVVMFLELVGDGLQAAEAAVAEEIRQKEPQSDVVIRKCFGLRMASVS